MDAALRDASDASTEKAPRSGTPRPGEEFRELLKARARGPAQLGALDPESCERAMTMILSGAATHAQAAGFLLVGRAAGDSAEEMAAYTRAAASFARLVSVPKDASGAKVVTVAGGFDGKLRTLNSGAAASLVAASAGARILMLGGESTPPKEGRTVFDALRNLGANAPRGLSEAELSLRDSGFAATTTEYYLPELHDLPGLRWEMTRRTALNVVEKLVSPVAGSARMVGVTHASFLRTVPGALAGMGVERALVYQAIEGSDEAPLDGNSSLVIVRDGESEMFAVDPASLGLRRAAKSHVPWRGEEDEARRLRRVFEGEEEGEILDLIIYNAALRLWTSRAEGDPGSLREMVEEVRLALDSGAAFDLLRLLATRCGDSGFHRADTRPE